MGPVLLWWVALEALGLISLPLAFSVFAPTSAYGYPFAKVISLLCITYVAWLVGYALPMSGAVYTAIGLLVAVSAIAAWWRRQELTTWLAQDGWRTIVRHDLLWT